jgi:hypothetical protein
MRVLWATRHRPDPGGGGGAVAEFEYLRAASAAHDVTVVSGGLAPGEEAPLLTELGITTVGVEWTPQPRRRSRAAALAQLRPGNDPRVVSDVRPCAVALTAAVASLEAAGRFDPV